MKEIQHTHFFFPHRFLYIQTENNWVPWFTYVLAVISTIFAYIVILLVSSSSAKLGARTEMC